MLRREAKEEAGAKVKTLRVKFEMPEGQAAKEGAGAGEIWDEGEDPAAPARGGTARSSQREATRRLTRTGTILAVPRTALVFASITQYHLHQAACHAAPLPTDLGVSFRQDWRGHLFRRGKDGGYAEVPLQVTRFHKANGYDSLCSRKEIVSSSWTDSDSSGGSNAPREETLLDSAGSAGLCWTLLDSATLCHVLPRSVRSATFCWTLLGSATLCHAPLRSATCTPKTNG